ncbi:hypothetical protein JJE64_03095 [Alloprevotella tannerae]|uniref:hypothetical protein n=1 Tax=Alloprevotella tannerae TaxID=76122 RepID=UPI001EDA381B|nr:hypothetical protein [Alloprevotella tannerae]MCG2650393.1 hypothetical protein [Alloprevotella tannerae]
MPRRTQALAAKLLLWAAKYTTNIHVIWQLWKEARGFFRIKVANEMLFPQKRRPAPLYFSSAAHCILYFDKDLAHEDCFQPTSPASAVGLVAANDSLFPANHSLAAANHSLVAANHSLVAANNEELRRQPLFLYLLPRIPKGLPPIVSMCCRPLPCSFVEKALACG